MNTTDIQKILIDWGRAQQTLPDNNQLMKNQLLAKLAAAPLKPDKSPARVPWLSFALTGLAIICLVISSLPQTKIAAPALRPEVAQNTNYQNPPTQATAQPMDRVQQENKTFSAGAATNQLSAGHSPAAASPAIRQMPDYYSPPASVPNSIADTREFLKTDFEATIKTLRVQELSQRLETTVRGYSGRVDSSSNSDESGYIDFVIPASKLEAFKQEVKDVAGVRFYTETLSSENLLGQKQNLEGNQKSTTDTLNQLNANLAQLTQTHNQTVASLQAQINSSSKQLRALENETTTDASRMLQIQTQEQNLQDEIKNLQSRLNNENYQYSYQQSDLNGQITDAQNTLKNLGEQTSQLLDSVATVHGTIWLEHINLWEFCTAFVSGFWIAAILLLGAIFAFWWQKI